MGPLYQINQRKASLSDFEDLREISLQIQNQADSYFFDSSIQEDEIKHLLDTNHNHKLELIDCFNIQKKLGNVLFHRLKDLLSKHGFNFYAKVEDLDGQKPLSTPEDEILWNDREFILESLRSGIDCADKIPVAFYKNDEEIIWEAVYQNPDALQYVGEVYKKEKSLVLMAVRKNGASLQHADISLRNNKNVVMEAVKQNGYAIRHAGFKLQSDPDIALFAVNNFPKVLAILDPTLCDHTEIVRVAVLQDGMMLQYASDRLKKNRGMVLEAMDQNLAALQFADQSLLQDFSWIRLIASKNSGALRFIDLTLLSTDQLYDLCLTTLDTLSYIQDRSQQEALWPLIQQHILEEGMEIPIEMKENPETFFRELSQFTRFPVRFGSWKSLLTLWENRKNMEELHDPRPIALLISSKNDWNMSFESFKIPDAFLESGLFRTFYFEVNTEQELLQVIQSVHQTSQQKIHTLVISGHGNKEILSLAEEGLAKKTNTEIWAEEYYIDLSDFAEGDFANLSHYLQAGGQVLINSCKSGEGEENSNNLANAFGTVLPPSITIFSNQDENRISGLDIDPKSLRLKVSYSQGSPYNFQGRQIVRDVH